MQRSRDFEDFSSIARFQNRADAKNQRKHKLDKLLSVAICWFIALCASLKCIVNHKKRRARKTLRHFTEACNFYIALFSVKAFIMQFVSLIVSTVKKLTHLIRIIADDLMCKFILELFSVFFFVQKYFSTNCQIFACLNWLASLKSTMIKTKYSTLDFRDDSDN